MKTGARGPNPSLNAFEHASDQARFKRPEDLEETKHLAKAIKVKNGKKN